MKYVSEMRASPCLQFVEGVAMPAKLNGYQQGDLDCFCGFYTLVNLVNHLRGPYAYDDSSSLFEKLVNTFESNWTLREIFVEGINGFQMSKLLNNSLLKDFNLISTKPFHSKPLASQRIVLTCIAKWVHEGGVVIWGNETHWTLIVDAKERVLILLDSSGQKEMKINKISRNGEGNYQLCPQHLYFIKRREDAL